MLNLSSAFNFKCKQINTKGVKYGDQKPTKDLQTKSNPVLKLRGTLAARAPRALLGLQDDGGGRGRLFSVSLLRLESSFVFSIKFGVDKPSVQTDNSEPLSEMYRHFMGIKGGETFCLISRFDAFRRRAPNSVFFSNHVQFTYFNGGYHFDGNVKI